VTYVVFRESNKNGGNIFYGNLSKSFKVLAFVYNSYNDLLFCVYAFGIRTCMEHAINGS